jgi:tetratricopeptide (TPR) repeat protein
MRITPKAVVAGLLLAVNSIYILRKAIPGYFWRTAVSYQDNHDYEMAEKYLLKALTIEKVVQKMTGSAAGVAHISTSLGFLYHHQRRLGEAVEMFSRALSEFANNGHNATRAPILAAIGKAYFDSGELALAEDNLRKAREAYGHHPAALEGIRAIDSLLEAIVLKRDNQT